jgi:ATP-binding cassette subfamily C protein
MNPTAMTHASLFEFFDTTGTACEARSGAPLWLHGDAVWRVDAGKIDVFLAKMHDGHPDSALRPLFRVESGQMLYGMPETAASAGWRLVALGVPGNRLLRLDRSQLQELARQAPTIAEQAAELLDNWVEQLASTLATSAPAGATLLEPNSEQTLHAGLHTQSGPDVERAVAPAEVLFAQQRTLWLSSAAGQFRFLGRADALIDSGAAFFPLPRLSWLDVAAAGSLRVLDCAAFLLRDAHWKGLDAFHHTLLGCLAAQVASEHEQEQQRLQQKSKNEAQNIRNAMCRLAAILDQGGTAQAAEENDSFPLLAACRLLGGASGITFAAPPPGDRKDGAKRDLLGEIVDVSRVRRRRVALKGAWWTKDNGNLLGFIEDGKHPVALLQTATGYILHDPVQGTARLVTAEVAAGLTPFGFVFYRSFGTTMVDLVKMLKFGCAGNTRDFLLVAMMGVAGGLLGMVTPLATGMLFDSVIPGAERGQLVQLTLMLLAGAFATAMFELTRGFAMLRAEGKMDSAIQSAVWDRLLRLPTPFFRDYTAGDLAARASGINTIRQILSGNTLNTLLSAFFAVFNLFLLFYYSMKLALLGIALVAIAVLFTAITSYLRLRHTRTLVDIEGRISGLVFQLLGSVAKLRTTGAESRAFFNWAMLFARQQEYQFKATMLNNVMAVFNAIYPTVASMAIFFAIASFLAEDKTFSTGAFLAFNAAFGGFLGAMLSATAVFASVLSIIPIYERAKPILQTPAEISDSKAQPGQLSGEIEISHLSFSYTPDGPCILDDISMQIKPGEFVALVGSSGSGKSTLLRLLLGFETPGSGSIYYDEQDMSGIDLGAIRRQLGVVLQNGQLLSGDIFTNIIGSAAALTLDDAWEAATQAGIADDIRAMPMGMHTVVSDGGSTLSGGQRQRLLIARAIVNRPRILFFDEATSALDNRAQEMVSTSLENLRATRIVIAHRLSTIINADRIFVMDGGKLAQCGTYAELIEREGLFADLAKRQIV